MPEFKVYITEDAEQGLDAALAGLDARVTALIASLDGVRSAVLATVDTYTTAASDAQSGLWNSQAAKIDTYGKEQMAALDLAYDDPSEDLEALSSKAYSAEKPIFRSSSQNQAQSYRKHLAQNRIFAHDGMFVDPSARVFPWHQSVKNQQRFVLQTALEESAWDNFFEAP